uniref:Putative DNA binding, helix-turn-helix domain containing protein n=1 Tax=viral metagenome TaxID=1070528 RepID=A0A6H2A099_9ZZZZ
MPGRAWRSNGHPPRFCSMACRKIGMVGQPCKRARYVITPEMHERIEKVYKRDTGNGQVAALAKALGLPRWKVTRYAISQGWIAKQKKEPYWTEEETDLLQKLARYSPRVIRHKMIYRGYIRTETAIVLKMKRMSMRQNLEGHSARDVARCLGVDDHFVTRAIKAGHLKATRRGLARTDRQGGDHWYIRDKAIKDYILSCLHEIDIRKVNKYWFVDMVSN